MIRDNQISGISGDFAPMPVNPPFSSQFCKEQKTVIDRVQPELATLILHIYFFWGYFWTVAEPLEVTDNVNIKFSGFILIVPYPMVYELYLLKGDGYHTLGVRSESVALVHRNRYLAIRR